MLWRPRTWKVLFPRFSLRVAFVLFTGLCLACAAVGYHLQRAQAQAQAVAGLQTGGWYEGVYFILYDFEGEKSARISLIEQQYERYQREQNATTSWLHKLGLGNLDFHSRHRANAVMIAKPVAQKRMEELKKLPHLRYILVYHGCGFGSHYSTSVALEEPIQDWAQRELPRVEVVDVVQN